MMVFRSITQVPAGIHDCLPGGRCGRRHVLVSSLLPNESALLAFFVSSSSSSSSHPINFFCFLCLHFFVFFFSFYHLLKFLHFCLHFLLFFVISLFLKLFSSACAGTPLSTACRRVDRPTYSTTSCARPCPN